MILLAGATGLLGGKIAQRLLDDRRPLRVLVRDPLRAAAPERRGAQIAVGDLTRRDTLDRAMAGVTHVITTANWFLAPSRAGIESVDVQGNRNLIDAARAAGVKQFVFTSAWLPDAYTRIDYFNAKRQTETYLRASGLTYTILRPAAFMDIWGMIVGDPILKTGKVQIFGDGKNPVNFVAADDVAAIAVRTLDHPAASNAIVDIYGPENLTLLEVAAVFERIKGTPARKVHLPVPVMKVLGAAAGLFNPRFARQVKAGALLATLPAAADPTGSREAWGVPMTTLEQWASNR
jgi:NADH dehydrogenase